MAKISAIPPQLRAASRVTLSSFAHGFGTSTVLPHMKNFKPTPNMTPLEIAHGRGKEARRKGHGHDTNPHHEQVEATLHKEWLLGYGDTRKP